MGERESTDRPKVMAVILTWNDVDLTAQCLESLNESTYPNLEVVVVDNGSRFPTLEPLQERFSNIHTVQLDENEGFTGGCNRGMEYGLESNAEYIFLLNNDTIVDKDAVPLLVDEMEANPDVGMASALIISPGADRRIQSYCGTIHRNRAWISRPDWGVTATDEHAKTVDTEFAPACGVMFRSEMLREVGLFDERLFTNWEDYDLCVRIADGGWRIVSVGGAEVVHLGGQTTGYISPFIVYYGTRNRLICLFRHGTTAGILANSPYIFRTHYWKVKTYGYTNWAGHKAFLLGIAHFLLGVRGRGKAPASRDDSHTGKKRYA